MARKTNNRIWKQNLLLCEGRDAENFLIEYLNSDSLASCPFFSNDIQVMNFGGNEELPKFLEALKVLDGYDEVKSLLVIRDAERDIESAKSSVKKAFHNAALPVPEAPYRWTETGNENSVAIKTGFLLFPTCDNNPAKGTLEDLCLNILSDKYVPILDEIVDFMESLAQNEKRTFPHEFKTKLHTWFSVTDDFVSMKVGEAARAGAFNWESQKLLPLKDFLLELLSIPSE